MAETARPTLTERFQRSSLSLATKLLGIVLIAVLVPQLIAGAVNYVVARGQTLDQVGTDVLARQARSTSSVLANYLSSHLATLETASLNGNFSRYLMRHNQRYEGLAPAEIEADLRELDVVWQTGDLSDNRRLQEARDTNFRINALNTTLASYQSFFPELEEIYVTDTYGGIVGLVGDTAQFFQGEATWWDGAFSDGEGAFYIGEPTRSVNTGRMGIEMAVPIRIDGEGEMVGILHALLAIEPMVTELSEVNLAQGEALLFHGRGDVLLAGAGMETETIPADLNSLMMNDPQEYLITEGVTGNDVLIGHTTLGSAAGTATAVGYTNAEIRDAVQALDWHVYVQQPTAQALSGAQRATLLPGIFSLTAGLLGVALAYLLIRSTTRQAEEMLPAFSAIEQGDTSVRVPVVTGDELGVMAASFNTMLDNTAGLVQSREERDQIQMSIEQLLNEVSQVAEGDLTAEAEVTGDMTGAIADSFNFMIEQLRDIILNVQDATLQVSSSANEIQTTAEHLAMGSESQAVQIVDTSAAIDEMSVSIAQVSESAAQSAAVSEQARANARLGSDAVSNTIAGMNRIRTQVQDTSARIDRLEESSQQIGEIVELIDDIADRTSILALNATIQAEMAGEAGRSFAVVAEEVERLAVRSTKATQQIGRLIRNIQTEMREVAGAMQTTNQEVQAGTRLADQAGQRLGEIETVSERLAELISQISQAAQQQARGSESIARSMNDIADVTQQTAAGTKQATTSIGNLAELADRLRSSVSRFKLPTQYAAAD